MRAQPAPDAGPPSAARSGAGEHAFGGDRRRAGGIAAEHLRVGASSDGANRSSTWTWVSATTGWKQQDSWLFDGVDHPLEHDSVGSAERQYYELDLAGNVRR